MSDPTTPVIDGQLMAYFAERERQRDTAVARRWAALSPREQRLVREAAVMGYVQGVRSVPGSHDTQVPPDSTIIARVINACAAMSDLYPTIYRAGSRRRDH